MMKSIKKIVAAVLAGMMVIGSLTVTAFAADEATHVTVDTAATTITSATALAETTEVEFTLTGGFPAATASLYMAAYDWSWQTETSPTVDVTGDGTFKVTATGCSGNAGVFVVDIPVATEAIDITATEYKVSDVKVNGEAVNYIYGDTEGKGNVRIEIYNQYGPTKAEFEDAKADDTADTGAAEAVVKTVTEIKYNFTVTTFVAAEDYTIKATASDWADAVGTLSVTGEGAATATVTFDAAKDALVNLGYIDNSTAKNANILSLDSIEIDGVKFTWKADADAKDGNDAVAQCKEINPTDGQKNGFPNIWNPAGQQAIVAEAEDGTVIMGGTETITVGTPGKADGGKDEPAVDSDDPADPGFNAYFHAQTKAYTFRNNWDEGTYGYGTDDFNKVIWWNENDKAYVDGVKITDALNISGNGVYYIVVEGWNDPSENTEWNMLGFSTDIPVESGVVIDAKCYINGKVKYSSIAVNEADDNKYVGGMFVNEYNADQKGTVDTTQPAAGARIVMQLTVSGMDSDNAAAVEDKSIITGEAAADETTVAAETTAAANNGSNNGVPFYVWIIIGGVVVVVAVVVVVCVVVAKKKKNGAAE